MKDLRVAVVQSSATGDAEANTAAAVAAIAAGAAAGARLVLLPEYTIAWAPRLRADLGDHAQEFATAVAGAAAAGGVWVIAGSLEPTGERLHNVALAFGPDGAALGTYVKVHLFDAFGVRESDVLAPGDPGAGTVIDVDGWRVGLATCYDLRFPESFRVLADGAAHVMAVGAAWAAGPGKADQLDVLARARALENTSYLLLASQTGQGRTGRSAVLGPLGEVLAQAGTDPDLLVVDLSWDHMQQVRETVPSLQHRRYRVAPLAADWSPIQKSD